MVVELPPEVSRRLAANEQVEPALTVDSTNVIISKSAATSAMEVV